MTFTGTQLQALGVSRGPGVGVFVEDVVGEPDLTTEHRMEDGALSDRISPALHGRHLAGDRHVGIG